MPVHGVDPPVTEPVVGSFGRSAIYVGTRSVQRFTPVSTLQPVALVDDALELVTTMVVAVPLVTGYVPLSAVWLQPVTVTMPEVIVFPVRPVNVRLGVANDVPVGETAVAPFESDAAVLVTFWTAGGAVPLFDDSYSYIASRTALTSDFRCVSRAAMKWAFGLIAINVMAKRIANIPITTNSSISVNPC